MSLFIIIAPRILFSVGRSLRNITRDALYQDALPIELVGSFGFLHRTFLLWPLFTVDVCIVVRVLSIFVVLSLEGFVFAFCFSSAPSSPAPVKRSHRCPPLYCVFRRASLFPARGSFLVYRLFGTP